MKLIREEIESVDFIVEERNGKKSLFIEGISFRVTSRTVMVGCIPWRLSVAKLLDTMKITL